LAQRKRAEFEGVALSVGFDAYVCEEESFPLAADVDDFPAPEFLKAV
jgi:hypothetical protein